MRLLKLLVAVVLCLNIPLVVFAHPGRTDSSGGHYNRSTGEYHYHHGYSEHQHYDTDGDGILDCPYKKVDKTQSSKDKSDTPKKTSNSTKQAKETRSTEEKVTIACCAIFACMILIGSVKLIYDEIKKKRKR